jgi:hypothetical protein
MIRNKDFYGNTTMRFWDLGRGKGPQECTNNPDHKAVRKPMSREKPIHVALLREDFSSSQVPIPYSLM